MPLGPLETNCYLIADKDDGAGAVIDPGDYSDQILAVAERRGVKIEKIIVTHGHWDHIGALARLAELTGAEVLVHEKDAEYLTDPEKNLSGLVFERRERPADRTLRDGDIIKIGDLDLKIVHTPGHTPGSLSVVAGGSIFCGDLIFRGSIGRTDLPGGNQDDMRHSIHEKALTLPDETTVYPGHGPATTIGHEREHNPYITGDW
jgi:glyoxylase-like metal-dependent hydrolase (beta-lactamase superfamily II)